MRVLILLVGTAALLAQSPEARFQEAQQALSQGHADGAIAILAELAAKDPMAPVLWVNLGLAHYQKGDYRGAQTPHALIFLGLLSYFGFANVIISCWKNKGLQYI